MGTPKIKKRNKKRSKIVRFFYYLYYKIIRIRSTPHDIALSFAAGAFVGVMPTFGVASILCIMIASFLKLNILATVLGSWVSNPWTAPFFYMISYKIGQYVVMTVPLLQIPFDYRFHHKMALFFKTGQYLLIGGTLFGSIIAIFCYAIIYKLTYLYQAEKQKRKELKNNA